MKFTFATHGTRGDIEPCAALSLELLRRGHEVRMACPPNLVDFVKSIGLMAVPYGPDSQQQLSEDYPWKIRNPVKLLRAGTEYISRDWAEMSATLMSLADDADLMLTGPLYEGVAANVAEYYNIPLVALHHWPVRTNGHLIPIVPPPLHRLVMSAGWRLQWHLTKAAENTQRRELGLPKASSPAPQRFLEREVLEIQAYDGLFFPGLAAEWRGRRPFVGTLALELPTDADDEVAAWIAAGTPPIYFGFGSTPLESTEDTVAMIAAACRELGERALIYAGADSANAIPHGNHDDVKFVGLINYAAVFPSCRAIVHHGGAGTTAAGLRAGTPMLILWNVADQPLWAAEVRRLKTGLARNFARTTQKSLTAQLRSVLAPQYLIRARETATQMTKPDINVATAANLVETAVRPRRAS